MKNGIILSIITAILLWVGCKPSMNCGSAVDQINKELNAGNFNRVHILSDSVRKYCAEDNSVCESADSLEQLSERISLDFSLTGEEVKALISKRVDTVTPGDIKRWEDKGWLEYRIINGEKMYFRRTVSNLFLLKRFYEEKDKMPKESEEDPEKVSRLKNTEKAFRLSVNSHNPVVPINMEVTYSITVKPDVVPDGQTVRCWMPWPRSDNERQKNIRLLGTSNPEYIISPDTATHSTIYMERMAQKGRPTLFRVSFSYQSNAQYFNLPDLKILPYNKQSDLYRKYTSEQPPQITFPENIRNLADSIAGNGDDPLQAARNLYMWFKQNIPWTGALEYSIMPDIPGYVFKNRRGDCGMQTFLYMSMLRYKGIPVRWQSGWMVPPGAENLHDWCEIYYEGIGWVPSDVSYDLQNTEINRIREYFFSGLDSYRLIVNKGVAGNLYPGKYFIRSEPYDFQRGEVEWSGENLYFDKWEYDIDIRYLQ
jgi:hypothetical protein